VNDLRAMSRLIEALRPWLEQLVIVGGWAHQLYRFHPLAKAPVYEALHTRDADIALARDAPLAGDIGAALRAAEFREEFMAEHTPPVTHYRLGDEDEGFYVEFLAPLHGDGLKRTGEPDVTVLTAGVTAQKLRNLDILLTHPWPVQLRALEDVRLSKLALIMVANPVTFMTQKILIWKHRSHDKRAQDALYIHDTLELFGHDLEALRGEWLDHVRPTLTEKLVKDLGRLRRQQFGAVTDVLRDASRMPQDRALAPDRLQAACAFGLEQIFGKT
jgi:hypothetical protein